MEKLRESFKEYSEELFYKVEWSSWEELQGSTITVFVACLLIAVIIAVMDLAFKYATGFLYSLWH